MTVTFRALVASTLASATIGGGVGALTTAATTSQASPAAIAAAVQRVRDANAENALSKIEAELVAVRRATFGTCVESSTQKYASPNCGATPPEGP